jgi:hypothetical protein
MPLIVIKHPGEPDEIATCTCGHELQTVEMIDKGVAQRSRFAFAMTHKKDGTPIRHLATKGAFLGVMELGWCEICQHHVAVLDSTEDKKYWASLPKWEKRV